MLFIRLLEVIVFIILMALIITQLVIPAVRGTQLFPLFRPRRKLEGQLAAEREMSIEDDLVAEIRRQRKERAAREESQAPKKPEPRSAKR